MGDCEPFIGQAAEPLSAEDSLYNLASDSVGDDDGFEVDGILLLGTAVGLLLLGFDELGVELGRELLGREDDGTLDGTDELGVDEGRLLIEGKLLDGIDVGTKPNE